MNNGRWFCGWAFEIQDAILLITDLDSILGVK